MAENEKSGESQNGDEMTESEIDETLAQSFPASDPPSWTLGTDHKVESEDDESGPDENGKPTSD